MLGEFLSIWKKKDLFTQVHSECIETLKADKAMFVEAMHSLRESDNGELKFNIFEEDKRVNKAVREIRKRVATHLVISDKSDIITGLVITSIVIYIERIGDYTKNIADLTVLHKKKLHGGNLEYKLVSIEDRVKKFFDITIKAFSESDLDFARHVLHDYKGVSDDCDDYIEHLIKSEEAMSNYDAVTLGLYLRFLKRVAAHLFNVCTSVVNPFHRIGFKEKPKIG